MELNAERIENTNDDLSVCNVARTSFDKWNFELNPARDYGLIKYLAVHKHISPFFHQRFTFIVDRAQIDFNAILSDETLTMGLITEFADVGDDVIIQHSFFGWMNLYKHGILSQQFSNTVISKIHETMPISLSSYIDDTIIDSILSKQDEDKLGKCVSESDLCDMGDSGKLINKFETITFRLTMPIFVARQMFTHRRFATNEISRRYVSNTPDFYTPPEWRGKPTNGAKQGSSDESITEINGVKINDIQKNVNDIALNTYNALLTDIAPEQARMILPQSMFTQVIFTGSRGAWMDMLSLRLEEHAQKETRDLAKIIKKYL